MAEQPGQHQGQEHSISSSLPPLPPPQHVETHDERDRKLAKLNEESAAQKQGLERRHSFSESKAREVKVVMLGNAGVGKSSLLLRFTNGTFEANVEPTVGVSFQSKLLIVGVRPFKFQVWDTAGQERYHSLAPLYYRSATAAVLVYDMTDRHSFTASVRNWVAELREFGPRDLLLVLVGNKADLAEERRAVTTEEGAQYAASIGAHFLETSALSSQNVEEIFTTLGHSLISSGRDRSLSTAESNSLGAAVARRRSGSGSMAAAAAAATTNAASTAFHESDDDDDEDEAGTEGGLAAALRRRDSLTLLQGRGTNNSTGSSCC